MLKDGRLVGLKWILRNAASRTLGSTTVAATAFARELVGFCWALMRLPA